MRLALLALVLAVPASASSPLAELRSAAGAQGGIDIISTPPGRGGRAPGRAPGARGSAGREAAAAFCGEADFDSDKRECMAVVSRSDYFDVEAVNACRRVNFSSEHPGCAAAIADKTFLRAEVDLCGRESFGSGIISCFQRSGRPWRGGRDGDAYIRRQLLRVKRLMQEQRYREAERALDDVIISLEP
jgi:hypothetical protein